MMIRRDSNRRSSCKARWVLWMVDSLMMEKWNMRFGGYKISRMYNGVKLIIGRDECNLVE